MAGAVLGVYSVCRLKLIRRMCMYRGAACKVLNAYEAYGPELTPEEVVLSPRLTDRSDGAFLIAVLLVALVALACHRTDGLAAQLAYRTGALLGSAAVVGEIVRALERGASQRHRRDAPRAAGQPAASVYDRAECADDRGRAVCLPRGV